VEKIRVLLADDHEVVREGLRQLIENEEDMECIALAENGEQAIELARELKPDVAIVDVSMPKVSGIQALTEIKKVSPITAILILSAYDYRHYITACIKNKADGYLLKRSLPVDAFIDSIRMIHKGEVVFDREATANVLCDIANHTHTRRECGELAPRELEVLKLAIKGMSNKKISFELGISEQTVGTHFNNVLRKLGVESRTQAAFYALREGLIDINDPDLNQESAN
jgi:DNA-binding NarL/FixJ family response regulator